MELYPLDILIHIVNIVVTYVLLRVLLYKPVRRFMDERAEKIAGQMEHAKELEEAARVDGCSDLGIFLKIILPLSKPTIASVSLFYAVGHWNSYFSAMLYISDRSKEVVQIALRRIIFLAGGINTDGTPIDWGAMGQPPEKAVKMATTVVATVPILLIYPFVQKYFTQGVMVGAVKG